MTSWCTKDQMCKWFKASLRVWMNKKKIKFGFRKYSDFLFPWQRSDYFCSSCKNQANNKQAANCFPGALTFLNQRTIYNQQSKSESKRKQTAWITFELAPSHKHHMLFLLLQHTWMRICRNRPWTLQPTVQRLSLAHRKAWHHQI